MAPPTYTKSQHRRSMISMDAFKPGRGKLHKLWTSRNSVSGRDAQDWTNSDLSTAIPLAGTQMDAIGNPTHPMAKVETSHEDSAAKNDLDRLMEEDAMPSPQVSIATPVPPSYAPPSPPTPPPMYHAYCPPSLAAPMRVSPPSAPSIPELSAVNYDADEERDTAMPIVSPARPMSTFRRRAKTPVHSIGQLEGAVKRKQLPPPPSGLARASSVSTIAREYRDLVNLPEELEGDSVQNPNYTHFDSTDSDHDASSRRSSRESERNEPSELSDSTSDWQESRLAICLGSDDGTLVELEEPRVEEAAYLRPLSLTPPTTPPLLQLEVPAKKQQEENEEEEMPTPTTLRFRIGLELLTRELSSAMSRGSNDASGLQIWVMIEAYERLRDQIAASSPENEDARRAIDSWVEALHAIHKNMTNEKGGIAMRVGIRGKTGEVSVAPSWPLPAAAARRANFQLPGHEEVVPCQFHNHASKAISKCQETQITSNTHAMDDDYGADDALLDAMAAAAEPRAPPAPPSGASSTTPIRQPVPQRIQRLDKAPPSDSSAGKVVQPTPQALPQRQSGSTILVSPRQRGNPVLTSIRSMPWEYSDIPADFVLGITTCALFLSLKYHRLHTEYIYTRIRNLQGKYNLRVLLTMVDIPNHEDSLRELSKTSLVNNVTLILCWSAAEAARYLELYKSYENANFAAIRGQQASSYADRLIEFVTVPRSLNKSDAVALVANFGSLKNAINADAEQLGSLSGWGGVKVKRWCSAIDEPFRAKKAAKRGLPPSTERSQGSPFPLSNGAQDRGSRLEQAVPLSRVPLRDMPSGSDSAQKDANVPPKQFQFMGDSDDEEALVAATIEESRKTAQPQGAKPPTQSEETLGGGVAAALARLRESG
ncbi:hypothetical protein HIM_05939 [Hirsutella minnesotensis 3608]|uniref:ERCC1-like central domain-containing protein n=1 Tax=Hirsutella minnesotensis 3608 TaxID=1043627 RepID=A0A0F8A525_9HYPO|nr:hypothetical protein HIM_05939 [Hirsutella minnesotensis 3608]